MFEYLRQAPMIVTDSAQAHTGVLDVLASLDPVASIVSSAAAFATVFLMVKYRQRDAKQYRYRRVVLEPILDAVPQMLFEAASIVEAGRKEIAGLNLGNLPLGEATDKTRELTQRFNEKYYQLNMIVLNIAGAWGEEGLTCDLRKELEGLQDAVTLEIEKLTTNKPPAHIGSLISERGAKILRIVVAKDDN